MHPKQLLQLGPQTVHHRMSVAILIWKNSLSWNCFEELIFNYFFEYHQNVIEKFYKSMYRIDHFWTSGSKEEEALRGFTIWSYIWLGICNISALFSHASHIAEVRSETVTRLDLYTVQPNSWQIIEMQYAILDTLFEEEKYIYNRIFERAEKVNICIFMYTAGKAN